MGFSSKLGLAVALWGLSEMAAVAAPTVTYVGLGRYNCSGSTAECAQINFNNNQLEEMNRRHNQEDQDRAQRYIEENRQRERERKAAEQR